MKKFFLVATLLVTSVALNADSSCGSCPKAGTKTTTRTSHCPSGTCGSKSTKTADEVVVVEEGTTKNAHVVDAEEVVVVEEAAE